MKTNSEPAPTPAKVCGQYTRQNARGKLAPKDAAALICVAGMVRITAYSGSTMNGSSTWVIATNVPPML